MVSKRVGHDSAAEQQTELPYCTATYSPAWELTKNVFRLYAFAQAVGSFGTLFPDSGLSLRFLSQAGVSAGREDPG